MKQTKRNYNNHQVKNKRGKKIALGIFIALGTVIILSALIMVLNFLFAKNIKTDRLTAGSSEFLQLYEENTMDRDLPAGIEITGSTCTVDESTYTISVKIKSAENQSRPLQLQIYYNPEFSSESIVKIEEDDNVFLSKGEEKKFNFTGVISKGENPEEIKEKIAPLCFEIIIGSRRGRILLPVNFK